MSYRIYGKSGFKAITGILTRKVNGSQGISSSNEQRSGKLGFARTKAPNNDKSHVKMNTDIEIKKSKNNSYY